MHLIPLTNGFSAIVDEEDIAFLLQWQWRAHGKFPQLYAVRDVWLPDVKKLPMILMHRVLCGCPTTYGVDHINGDGLDNRKANLRLCTSSLNQANRKRSVLNTSGFKGVTWNRSVGKWQATIKRDGKNFYLGVFDSPHAAHDEYKKAALSLFGEFASTELAA